MTDYVSDWLSRVVNPDLYPRSSDPFQPAAAMPPATAPLAVPTPEELGGAQDIYSGWVTMPGGRPGTYQRAANFQVTADVTPVALMKQPLACDAILLSVASTAANSVFFGYGSGVTVSSGIEIRPGVPVEFAADNTREQWELQRLLEVIAAMIASERGWNPPGTFRAPRVVFNAGEYFVTATAPTTVAVMLFSIPELQ